MFQNNKIPKAVIFGLKGTSLTKEEVVFFKKHNPLGFILFKRNCDSPKQIKKLCADLRKLLKRKYVPILIDQEGGRVARLRPPHFRSSPPCGIFADVAKKNVKAAEEAVYINTRIIAAELASLGINVDCAPVLDLRIKGAHDIIGDRAFGSEPNQVAKLAEKMCEGLIDGGVMPIIKHIPGHGRAKADSHEELPVVSENIAKLKKTDFLAFKKLNKAPWAMTAHIKYTKIDSAEPATLSKKVIAYIRKEIGFKGVLLTDDLSMKALSRSFKERTIKSLEAGCDVVLHCNGEIKEMKEIAENCKTLSKDSVKRLERAKKLLKKPSKVDVKKLEKKLAKLTEKYC